MAKKTQAPARAEMTIDEWREEAKRRGNGTMMDAPFQCPACGHVATARQFVEIGGEEAAELAPRQCIRGLLRYAAGEIVDALIREQLIVDDTPKGFTLRSLAEVGK